MTGLRARDALATKVRGLIRRPRVPRRPLHLSDVAFTGDPKAAARYFVPVNYRDRTEPAYFDDWQETGVEYQPDVYRRAARLARARGASVIVDVGCGSARKLVGLHPRFQIIGLDIGSNISRCRTAYPFGEWIEHDLESDEPLPIARETLQQSVIVCADVIEHLLAPDRALRVLQRTSASALLFSTPDRSRVYREDNFGPPANPSHVREWSREELAALLRWCGFEEGYVTHTRPHTWTIALETLLYVE